MYQVGEYGSKFGAVGNCGVERNVTIRDYDDVIAFSGMYGIDDYMMWYIHKNLRGHYDFSTMNIELMFFPDRNTRRPFFTRNYKVLDVKYDANKSKFVLYGQSLSSAKLQTKLVDYQVKSLSYDENRSVYRQEPTQAVMSVKKKELNLKLARRIITRNQYKKEWGAELNKVKKFGVLVDILEGHNIFKVEYMTSMNESALKNFEYRMFTFDEDWRVIDFINYIADQNDFEWFVRNNVLYIGKECMAIEEMNTTRKHDLETDNISNTAWFKKYNGITRQMDLMSHINKVWRCIWVKHMAGKSGGITKGCFTRIGMGTLSKENYLRTLEGELEKVLGAKILVNKPYSHYITLGNIIKDEGDQVYIDKVSIQKNKELYKINEPSDVKIDRVEEPSSSIFQVKEKVSRSTPYLDAGGGMLFPSPLLETQGVDIDGTPIKGSPPNSIIFNVKGKEEASIIGPYVMGNSKEDFKSYKIPFKGRKDFRFTLPNGWTMYVDGDHGKLLLQCSDVPVYSDIGPGFPYPGNSDFNPDGQENTYIYMRPKVTEVTSEGNEISLNAGLGNDGEEKGSKLRVTSNNGLYFVTHTASTDNKTTIEAKKTSIVLKTTDGTNTSEIRIFNTGEIEILTDVALQMGTKNNTNIYMEESNGNIDITGSGIIKIDATGEVTIDGIAVKLQGGGNKLSHADHKHGYTHSHTTGNIGMPIPPQTHIPGVAHLTDQHLVAQGTTTTEAE